MIIFGAVCVAIFLVVSVVSAIVRAHRHAEYFTKEMDKIDREYKREMKELDQMTEKWDREQKELDEEWEKAKKKIRDMPNPFD